MKKNEWRNKISRGKLRHFTKARSDKEYKRLGHKRERVDLRSRLNLEEYEHKTKHDFTDQFYLCRW